MSAPKESYTPGELRAECERIARLGGDSRVDVTVKSGPREYSDDRLIELAIWPADRPSRVVLFPVDTFAEGFAKAETWAIDYALSLPRVMTAADLGIEEAA